MIIIYHHLNHTMTHETVTSATDYSRSRTLPRLRSWTCSIGERMKAKWRNSFDGRWISPSDVVELDTVPGRVRQIQCPPRAFTANVRPTEWRTSCGQRVCDRVQHARGVEAIIREMEVEDFGESARRRTNFRGKAGVQVRLPRGHGPAPTSCGANSDT